MFKTSFSLQLDLCKVFMSKETVTAVSSDPPCKDVNARFITIPLKNFKDLVWIRYKFL